MKIKQKYCFINVKIIAAFFLFLFTASYAQEVKKIDFKVADGLSIISVSSSSDSYIFKNPLPLFSIEINEHLVNTFSGAAGLNDSIMTVNFPSGLKGKIKIDKDFTPGWKAHLTLENISDSNIKILNLVPLGQSEDHIYITGSPPWNLASSKIFRPGFGSIGVVLPDNAWSLGYSAIGINDSLSVFALARRMGGENTEFRRYSAYMKPEGKVEYDIYLDFYKGHWQNGIRTVFQDRYLYDLKNFDNKLFERKDLEWIRHSYVMALLFGWDHNFYDRKDGRYHYKEFLHSYDNLLGRFDIFSLWPTWPTLGLDQRNQWDLYSDLPGGLEKLKQLSDYSKSVGTKFFVSFNPWDQSTRKEDFYEGISRLVGAVDADGVVLDTYGSSSEDLQNAVDSVKWGVIMYSEGMAVPQDMPGIVAGRVHDAIYLPPPLNLNKFIKPDFAIFRVCTLNQGRLHREFAISFFNGYGVELNMMAPARPSWLDEEFAYLGKTTRILRENTTTFTDQNWTPIIPTLKDSIWVNKWNDENKTIYTIFSLIPSGYEGPLFSETDNEDYHFVDLWYNEEILLDTLQNKTYVPVKTDAFNRSYLGTRMEGNVDCVAKFPLLLNIKYDGVELLLSANSGDSILIWAGEPSYKKKSVKYDINSKSINLKNLFNYRNEKFVIQLFRKNELLDERVLNIIPGTPAVVSKVIETEKSNKSLTGMVEIPSGNFRFIIKPSDEFIPYPNYSDSAINVNRYFIDKYPVTNKEFKKFLIETNYHPEDTVNFLKNWRDGNYPEDAENYPVVYVSIEDAKAFANWAGKRLPTEIEWQYAAQCGDSLSWPWGSNFDSTKCNNSSGKLTSVDEFPEGVNKWGVADIVGNVWQLTNDIYDNGSHNFIIIRGGSYYNPKSSWWYVKGGPQPLNHSQMLLQVSPGFERNSTVGFRCVKDAVQKEENHK